MEGPVAKQGLSPIPEDYHTINPWVISKGAAKYIQFLKQVFEARKETKEAEAGPVQEEL